MKITALDILGLYQTEDPISVAMLLGHEPPPANPVRGRVVINEFYAKLGRRPDIPLPDGMIQGTRAAKAWRALPDPDDVPMSCGDVAREMRAKPTEISAVLTSMVAKGVAQRYVEADGSYGYTRAAMDAYEQCERDAHANGGF